MFGHCIYAQKDTLIACAPILAQKCYYWETRPVVQLLRVNNKILKKDTGGRLAPLHFKLPDKGQLRLNFINENLRILLNRYARLKHNQWIFDKHFLG